MESTVDNTTETDGTASGTSGRNTTNAANGSTWDLYSDTPQGGIAGIRGAENDPALGTDAYLTNARHIIDESVPSETMSGTSSDTTHSETDSNSARSDVTTGNSTTNDTGTYADTITDARNGTKHDLLNNTEDYLERVTGKTAGVSYSKMLMEFRETFLNIDKILIDSLEDLFFGLWEY